MCGGRVLVEDHDRVDAGERGQHFGALVLPVDRAGRSLVAADGRVGVEPDDQDVAERARGLQVADVAGMQQIEDAVGEDDPAAFGCAAPRRTPATPACDITPPGRSIFIRRSSRRWTAGGEREALGKLPLVPGPVDARRPWCATSRGTCTAGGDSRTGSRPACGPPHRACRCPSTRSRLSIVNVASASPKIRTAVSSSMLVLVP